jgi:hypothetical protein
MDIIKALRDLYNEKKRLDVAISSLEARLKAVRKGSTTKRQEVSKRMTLYWEARRAQARPSEVSPPTPADTPSTSEGQQASTTSA